MVKTENTRVIITMPKELKKKVVELSDLENRSISNLIDTVLLEYISKREAQIEAPS